ncbi:MAG: hypothetical protein ACLP8S_19115 [Solirubrobacteraceae bacterium]
MVEVVVVLAVGVDVVVLLDVAALASAAPPPAMAPSTAHVASALVSLFVTFVETSIVGFNTICPAIVRAV